MAPAVERPGGDLLAVAQQHRVLAGIGLEPDRELGQDVGPIDEIGYAAEAFRLALRAEIAPARIQAEQDRVRRRGDFHDRLDNGAVTRDRQRQPRAVEDGLDRLAVDGDRNEGQVLAVEHQRPVPVSLDEQAGMDPRPRRIEFELQRNFGYTPRRWGIVGEADRRGCGHDRPSTARRV